MKASELKPGQMFRFKEEGSSAAVFVCISVLDGHFVASFSNKVWCIRLYPKALANFSLLWCSPDSPVCPILTFHEGD